MSASRQLPTVTQCHVKNGADDAESMYKLTFQTLGWVTVRTDKPPWYHVASHLGQLSLLPSVGR